MTKPITRLFKLQRDVSKSEEFDRVGADNLTTSIKVEDGTLAMYATHVPEDPATCYVCEVYADDDAYQVHASSAQFKAYVQMASEVLTGREVYQLQPQLLVEKPEALCVTAPSEVEPHLVFVDIKPGTEQAFFDAIEANMRTAVDVEPGVLVMYAATMVDNPNRWVFWEVYASAEAYAAHRDADHFKAYIEATDDLVTDKEFHVLATDTLVSKG